jgi:hypothetical protein
MPPRFGATTSTAEHLAAASSSGDLAAAHTLLAAMCEDSERATLGIEGFIARTRGQFADVPAASATELPSDIHDMASIAVLAQQLAAPQPRQ